jgi:hypothetical protein
MSFWHTFVGEMIHGLSFGLIGPDDHPTQGGNMVINNSIPLDCYTDPDFFAKNVQTCTQSSVIFVPPPGGTVPTPEVPPIPTCTINCPGTSTGTITPPVSAVPEPGAVAMAIAGVVLLMFITRRRRS